MSGFSQVVLDALVVVFGACIGSFVNVVAYRLPRDMSIVRPGSFCPHCRQPIPPWANIPIVAYLALRGRCLKCRGPIPARYLISELGLGIVALYLYLSFPPPDALARFALCAALFAVSWIDIDWRIIPDVISLPGIPIGMAAAVLAMPEIGFKMSLYGFLLGGVLFFVVGEAYRLLRGQEGMGMGDVKLLAMIGAFLGWPGVLFTVLIGSSLGSVGGILVGLLRPAKGELAPSAGEAGMVAHEGEGAIGAPALEPAEKVGILQTAVPFGPFLSVAAAIYAIFQPQLARWYFS